jgi:hypothetical protein
MPRLPERGGLLQQGARVYARVRWKRCVQKEALSLVLDGITSRQGGGCPPSRRNVDEPGSTICWAL